jgi:hypothetical protein
MLIVKATLKTITCSVATRDLILLAGLFIASGSGLRPPGQAWSPPPKHSPAAISAPAASRSHSSVHRKTRTGNSKPAVPDSAPLAGAASSATVPPDQTQEPEILPPDAVSTANGPCSSRNPSPGYVRAVANEGIAPGREAPAILMEEDKGIPGGSCGAAMPRP